MKTKPIRSILPLLLIICVLPAVAQETELLDRFDRVSCSEFMSRLDTFLVTLSEDPEATGYVALSGSANYLDVFRRRRMIDDHLAFRNFDAKRVVFVRRTDLGGSGVELWKTGAGRPLTFAHEANWPYELTVRSRPFILLAGGFDASECPPARDVDFVAQFLKANHGARTNIVIRCRDRKCFHNMRRQMLAEIKASGIATKRVRFFAGPTNSDYYSYEFWILNSKGI